ncbi:MAG: hypothetical protein DYG83_06875 [Candidatus Brocadia sp. AMX2]|uniref:DUF7718 domain-containing protein n=1 Tax=Candidatus Brocadia sinica JPN1 TaxID=1197129 RepID=A0ABQ0JSJ7_9BACT|nr:MAG: hypothetical protein EDM70_00725 [Candidatus Brocadia sp. AMX2]KXK28150.1 MAG: hypothetical protein UZ01_02785 [Candidatus Brocadia sinica]MBC6931339.1 hypothetical protein [Candidatus Brocadia sp.]MBL1168686.1 hypothetical protein [Candidatus Brocadia sp. AMX1]GAN31696.1 hypothetical protein BROSI_A0200 [Candidatus Brocadia sinica JPN1]
MLKALEFTIMLSPDQEDRLRVIASKEKGKIVKFVAQYEAYIKNEWRNIVRYDTAHKDLIHPNGIIDKQPLPFTDFNVAFTFAIQDLKISWKWYRIAYEKEL